MTTEVALRRPYRTQATVDCSAITSETCWKCKRDLPLADFYKDASRTPLCISSKCKSCTREYNKEYKIKNAAKLKQKDAEYYQENSDAIKQRSADWRDWNRNQHNANAERYTQGHPEWVRTQRRLRRARIANVLHISYTQEQLADRMSMWNGLCWICLAVPWQTVDHVKPLARGGPEMLSNLRPACHSCNSAKGAKWPFDRKVR